MPDLQFASATAIAAAIRDGAVSSRAVVELYLERIARHNSAINAVVTLDAERACQRADECDRAQEDGRVLGPLHGVPVTIKDAFETEGLRTTSGLEEYSDYVPTSNAAAVQRLVDAGAVVLGKTNCPPGVTGQETANTLFGRTSNPWNAERTSGASSGGAAAALAAGLCALELGSDSGGSIRQPAGFCGVFGHFPTHGIVPSRGHIPQVEQHEIDVHVDLMSVGPLARHPEDLDLALDLLAGPDIYGQRAWALNLPAPPCAPQQMRVVLWPDDEDYPVDADIANQLLAVGEALREAGVQVDDAARPAFDFRKAEEVAFALWVASSSQRDSDEDHAEMQRRTQGFDQDDDSRGARRAHAAAMSHRDWLLLDQERRRMQRQWEDFFASVNVLICPVTPVTAYPHDPKPELVADVDHRIARTIDVNGSPRPSLDQLVWTTVVGMARLPSTVAPIGLDRDGMPIGAQIVGKALADRTTIAFAGYLAELLGGFRAPPAFA